jgi:hypothetical protein
MAVSPEDLAAGALALQVFIKNAQYVEIIVNVAFATIPSILGIGAAGLIGHGIINTAKEVRNSISLLKTVGPMAQVGWMAGKGLNTLRKGTAERLKQYNHPVPQFFGNFLTPVQWIKSKKRSPKTPKANKKGKLVEEWGAEAHQFLLIQSQIRKKNKPKSAEFHLMNT